MQGKEIFQNIPEWSRGAHTPIKLFWAVSANYTQTVTTKQLT